MKSPINEIDYQRFLRLAALCREHDTGEISIWASENSSEGSNYVHIEISAYLPSDKVREIFNLPINELMR